MHPSKHSESHRSTPQIAAANREKPTHYARVSAIALVVLSMLFLLAHDPALANKFETIGGGVGGSRTLKLDWLQGFLYVVGGISLLCALLAIIFPHNNAWFLNATNWKQSAAMLFGLSVLCFVGGFLL